MISGIKVTRWHTIPRMRSVDGTFRAVQVERDPATRAAANCKARTRNGYYAPGGCQTPTRLETSLLGKDAEALSGVYGIERGGTTAALLKAKNISQLGLEPWRLPWWFAPSRA